MAFRQPTHHAPQRTYTAPLDTSAEPQTYAQRSLPIADEEQEWILFSPVAESTTDRTYTATTTRTQTAGRSRISDFGSLDTAARSYDDEISEEEAIEDDETEDGELDSLDSHLHEFRSEPSVYRRSAEASGTVLPTHDGLGSFRIDHAAGMGEEVQEHLYAFEKFNPRRIKRRRESLELGQLELENERVVEAERIRRIEKWRMEQSRVLVDEIQRETRRRKQSISSDRRTSLLDREQEDLATLSTVGSIQNGDADAENESFWNRITRRVIRDLMGIDDDLLSIIFGENLPEDDDLSTMPPISQRLNTSNGLIPATHYDKSSWEYRLLERIARELGVLVNQISDHPGAFTTYLHTQQITLPYAGLPVIPESARDHHPLPEKVQESTNTIASPNFQPTIQPLAIPQPHTTTTLTPHIDENATPRQSSILASQTLTREEWEADLDIKMVFRYLRDRFTSKFSPSSATIPVNSTSASSINFSTHGTSHLATASTADTAARAARVRQHHPLVTRETRERERRRSIERRAATTWRASVPGTETAGGLTGYRIRRGSSSCASERISSSGLVAGVTGIGKRSGSSRHYWDFGPAGSVGSGSLIASTGGMGSWGEV